MKTRSLPTMSVLMLLATGMLTGCAHSNSGVYERSGPHRSLDSRLETIDLKALFNAIASEFCSDACCGEKDLSSHGDCSTPADAAWCGQAGERVIVTDFVDLQSFEPKKSGLVMAELLRGSLNQSCGHRVIQGEFSKYFKVSDQGLVILSRSASDIGRDYTGRHVVVGTYEYNRNKLLLFVKKINTSDNQIVRMVTKEIDFSPNGADGAGYVVK